ncbi:hypothetical protein [Streptomyces sp. NPDC059378]|uniref:hypothetical protein n=1 Tax=Streptomyces sp. NPDC059378 TaxID=3346815 RepID=UPI0036B208D9
MSEEERRSPQAGSWAGSGGTPASGEDIDPCFEEQVRELLAEDAYGFRPAPAPYAAVRRRGVAERRRRVAAAGAMLVTLAALPVGAYAVDVGGRSDTASPRPSAGAPRSPLPVSSAPVSAPATEPARPATEGQLLDGITWAQAADGLKKCIAYNESFRSAGERSLGKAADYRILLAMNSTGDSNAPGDGMYVVAVSKQAPAAQSIRLICTVKDGAATGGNTSVGNDAPEDGGPVSVDMNSGKLYQQSVIDRGHWRLPFGWAIIGTVDPKVTKVTVSYGDATGETVLDHGWFVAHGTLDRQVTRAPHVKGYDAAGKLVYDSDQDKYYEKTLP